MLTERQLKILYSTIQEHIKTAKPVASASLVKKLKLGLSPATIRNEFAELESKGFLEQPYTSSGRVPTSRAYRYFVDFVLSNINQERQRLDSLEGIVKSFIGSNNFNRHMIKSLANASNNMAMGWTDDDKNDDFYFSGFKNILGSPEPEGSDYFEKVGDVLDSIDNDMSRIVKEYSNDDNEKDVRVFIGSEVPIRGAKDFSLIVSSIPSRWGNLRVAILGPKRMDYEKNLRLISSIRKALE